MTASNGVAAQAAGLVESGDAATTVKQLGGGRVPGWMADLTEDQGVKTHDTYTPCNFESVGWTVIASSKAFF